VDLTFSKSSKDLQKLGKLGATGALGSESGPLLLARVLAFKKFL
jgi:hypothetical protein